MKKRFEPYNLKHDYGCIIGEVELVNCIKVAEKFNSELRDINPLMYARSNHLETYAWKLENVRKYSKPIYVKGKLGLWNYEVEKNDT